MSRFSNWNFRWRDGLCAVRGGSPSGRSLRASERAFTLVEVLAALLMMAIVIPVAMEGMTTASRAGMLGQRKAAAMRVAERVLNERVIDRQAAQASSSGIITEGDTNYPWTLRSESWPIDAMTQLTVAVTFTVQGRDYEVSASTLLAPAASTLLTP